MTSNAIPTTETSSAPPPAVESVKRAISAPAFVAAFVVLAVAALSLNAATQFMKLYFKKEAVPLAIPLEQIPTTLGPWVQVSRDQPMNAEMLDVLGTKNFVFRQYVDSRIVKPDFIAEFNDKTDQERGKLLARIQHDTPEAVMRVGLSYYTGMVDTVAHIPDRCYVADGFVPDTYEQPTWIARDKAGQPLTLPLRLINFEDTTAARGALTHNVAYFFNCNGKYMRDPIGVRMELQNLFEHYGYYAKVEMMNSMKDRTKAAAAMQDWLVYAMPEVEKCLPDWAAMKARGATTPTTATPPSASVATSTPTTGPSNTH